MCVCDHGFTGPDCSFRICAKGDDPLTINQTFKEFTIETYSDNGTPLGKSSIQALSNFIDAD